MTKQYANALLAEFIGVFTLCFIGILAIGGPATVGAPGQSTLLGVAFAHGLALVVMIGALAAVSGAHFNPAVTVGLLLIRRISGGQALGYIGAQLGGAVVACLLSALFGSQLPARGNPALANGVEPMHGLVLEVVATFFLVLVIVGSAVDKRAPQGAFPLLIGMTVVADILAIGPLTGAAMNPARAFGPALVSGHWANHWIYWVGPIAGACLAAVTAQWFLPPAEKTT